ncbi:hypothetical protein D3C86_1209430 [compost metagenome]
MGTFIRWAAWARLRLMVRPRSRPPVIEEMSKGAANVRPRNVVSVLISAKSSSGSAW